MQGLRMADKKDYEHSVALLKSLQTEVGAFRRAVTSLRYATRPLDLRFGFNLPLIAAIGAAGIAGTAFGIGWRRRRRERRIPAPAAHRSTRRELS